MCLYLRICIGVFVFVCLYLCVCICVFVFVCLYLCIYVCMCIMSTLSLLEHEGKSQLLIWKNMIFSNNNQISTSVCVKAVLFMGLKSHPPECTCLHYIASIGKMCFPFFMVVAKQVFWNENIGQRGSLSPQIYHGLCPTEWWNFSREFLDTMHKLLNHISPNINSSDM